MTDKPYVIRQFDSDEDTIRVLSRHKSRISADFQCTQLNDRLDMVVDVFYDPHNIWQEPKDA